MFVVFKFKKGFGMVEVLVGASIISLTLMGLVSLGQNYLKISNRNNEALQATFLLEESLEAVRLLRDDDWDVNIATLSSETDYFIIFNGSQFEATTTYGLIDGLFERKIVVSDVFRDPNDIIVPVGTLDDGIKKITAQVSWNSPSGTTTKSISTYLADIAN